MLPRLQCFLAPWKESKVLSYLSISHFRLLSPWHTKHLLSSTVTGSLQPVRLCPLFERHIFSSLHPIPASPGLVPTHLQGSHSGFASFRKPSMFPFLSLHQVPLLWILMAPLFPCVGINRHIPLCQCLFVFTKLKAM